MGVDVVKTGSSAGLIVQNASGSPVATFGAGGGTGTMLSDGLTCAAVTATSATGVKTLQAATQDAIALLGRAGGTGSYTGTITPLTLSANRT
jgi:hypothetical protein